MVGCSLLFLALAVLLGRKLQPRFGRFNATLLAAAAFILAISVVMGLLPSLGHLAANRSQDSAIGYGASATETPLPVRNLAGQIVYPGFPADVLWKFRFYSVLNQIIIWGGIGLIFSALLERAVGDRKPNPTPSREPLNV
jgi:Probable cobalt transporter subunit (CbtA)